MPCFVGLDVSKRTTSISVLDESGVVLQEGVAETDPKAIAAYLRGGGRRYKRVGMEVCGLSSWLHAGLAKAGFPIICIEARHAQRILKELHANKTDENDARGIAEIMRISAYKTVHMKSEESRRARALLGVRRLLRRKAIDVGLAIRGTLLSFGLKLRSGAPATYERRVRALVGANAFLSDLVEPLLVVRACTLGEAAKLETQIGALATADEVCRRLMTAPGVGPITALTFRAAMDEPGRFSRSRDVGAHFGLAPRSKQSGEKSTKGGISRCGDATVRAALYTAAWAQLRTSVRPSWLKAWGEGVAARRGRKKAAVAMARRLAITLHRMWVTQTDFRWSVEAA